MQGSVAARKAPVSPSEKPTSRKKRMTPTSATADSGAVGRSYYDGDETARRKARHVIEDQRIDWTAGAHWSGICGKVNPSTGPILGRKREGVRQRRIQGAYRVRLRPLQPDQVDPQAMPAWVNPGQLGPSAELVSFPRRSPERALGASDAGAHPNAIAGGIGEVDLAHPPVHVARLDSEAAGDLIDIVDVEVDERVRTGIASCSERNG
jgi:hypothetical protein